MLIRQSQYRVDGVVEKTADSGTAIAQRFGFEVQRLAEQPSVAVGKNRLVSAHAEPLSNSDAVL
jgi:hypothetical protein